MVFAIPFLMGTDKCEGGEIGAHIWDAINELFDDVEELDGRVTDLEDACTCEGILEPVCGDNGRTYINECEAACVGVEPIASGECPVPVCGGGTGLTCDDGSFCELALGCSEDEVGTCEAQPELCTVDFDPVCGCDGETYPNECERKRAGVSLDYLGRCDDGSSDVCSGNEDCSEGYFCATRGGDACEEMGVCRPQPEQCTREFIPVCGCDGWTYNNVCVAHAHGVSVDHRGPCMDDDKVVICHIPPGNPGNRHTIEVSRSDVPDHLRHGDHLGECHDRYYKHKKHKKHKRYRKHGKHKKHQSHDYGDY